jgi:hypothetical protein
VAAGSMTALPSPWVGFANERATVIYNRRSTEYDIPASGETDMPSASQPAEQK